MAPTVDPATQACLDAEAPAACVVKLARARIERGEEQEAVDALVAGIAKTPAEHTPYLELALLLQTNNRYDLAAQVLRDAKQAAKRRFLVHYLLASNYAAQGKMKESVAELEAARQLAPDDPDVLLNLALSYTKLEPPQLTQAASLLNQFGKDHCTSLEAPSCRIAAETMERIESKRPWPKRRESAVTLAPFADRCKDGVIRLPDDPIRQDSMFTIWGASHHLRSKPHRKAVTAGPISVVGHVVAHNFADAPKCAIHRADAPPPPHCDAPTPTIYLADHPQKPTSYIPVVAWSESWSALYEQLLAGEGVPNVGAVVVVTGRYGFSSPTGVSNPRFGVLTASRLEITKPSKQPATLPGL